MIVIVTRRDPPLRMTELRANGRLTEVRLANLRFNAEETRTCVGLCDAVGAIDGQPEWSESGGEVFLQTLQDGNLFTIALDDQEEWFRYHHLFRDLLRVELRKTLGSAAITVLHRRASDWFEQHALIGEAIHHALQARDVTGAAEILERHRGVEQDQDRWRNIERWLAVLPAETKEKRPGLLLSQAWVLHDRYQLRGIATASNNGWIPNSQSLNRPLFRP